ncbi:MAG: hypothetical protein GX825_00500 [Syntrophomonadaceae bacterium]|nr:hypothetical protein [Syntrophomonadaceae bacterium]
MNRLFHIIWAVALIALVFILRTTFNLEDLLAETPGLFLGAFLLAMVGYLLTITLFNRKHRSR